MRTFGIIVKKDSDESLAMAKELIEWLAGRSINGLLGTVNSDMEMLIILGGDGTLLHVANQASFYGIPVVGVNLGDLGFLTEVAVDVRYQALESIINGEALIEERMMLKTRLQSRDQSTEWQYALNDIVISKGNVDQLVRLSAWADKEYITTYRADGLIISTPTGSTAYNLSAGGPIVHPEQNSILVTPICPFMLESRPVLLPSRVRLSTQLDGTVTDVKVIVDGQFAWEMNTRDLLEVRASETPLRLITSPQKGYFEILRSKLNWGGRRTPPELTALPPASSKKP